MQQVNSPSVDKLPKVGYFVSKEEQKEKFYQNETHIHKQNALSGIKAGAHKLTNDVFTYFPKGFQGSKNSDFYEYLSLGMVPYAIGSVMMYSLYKAANGFFKIADKTAADSAANIAGAGVILYGLGKLASRKLSRTLINASTGVNLDLLYLKKVNELPEPGQEKGLVRTQYPGVFDSVNFYRNDLLDKDSELNHNDIYHYYDEIAKKAGYKEQLHAPNQTMGPKIRELKARTTALENISKYIAAACGVALGAQKSFKDLKFKNLTLKGFVGESASNIKSAVVALDKAFSQLWKGNDRNFLTKNFGKALMLGSVVSTLLTWLIPTIGFKTNPDTMKSKVDVKKEFEVC